MAHLQPASFSPDRRLPRRIRLTEIRGFMPNTVQLSGKQVKAVWETRFREKGALHPFWLYTHIPFCPQICTYCQCSTSLRKSDEQVTGYLRWLEGEIDFLAAASASAVVKFQYVGGGTPNLLTEPQLEWMLGKLNRDFQFDPASRRTFEFLPSSLRPETLPLVRSFGFNRLSCGIQSWSRETLKAVNRAQTGLDDLGRTIQDAYDLGYDEFNLDLIHGIGDEGHGRFIEGLLQVLALNPTTVTIHHLIPTASNPVYANVEEELAAYVAFEGLERALGEAVAREFPHIGWELRPNSWVLVDRRFREGSNFSYWYYSDNERIHIDMLSFGRFAHSNILGRICYENLSHAEDYDPEEASYRAFQKTPMIDAALDLVTDLVGDRRSILASIATRHGEGAVTSLYPVLERLQSEGRLIQRNECWEPVQTDGVFIDPFWPLLEAAIPEMTRVSSIPISKATENGIRIGAGERALLVFVEKIEPQKQYFSTIGNLGIYYRHPNQDRPQDQERWMGELMQDFLRQVRQLLDEMPSITAKRAAARLKELQAS